VLFRSGMSAEAAAEHRANDLRVFETGHAIVTEEKNLQADGLHTYLTVKFPLTAGDGAIETVCGVSTDITERKRAEEERVVLQEQLAQSRKMEAMGHLAGGVAHDFNNMLGVILGHAELALMKMTPDQRLYESLQEIRKAAGRSADLTRQLLAFARKQTVIPEVLDLNETVAGMFKMLQRLIGEDINLDWQPGENLSPLKMDPGQLDQILANLCINARDAIAGVGRITIRTENICLDTEFCAAHSGLVPGVHLLLTVSDNGRGMDSETLARIFEPFFTTKELGQGTGLGLATVYGIVKQNSGYISVSSDPGKMTIFSIYLPGYSGTNGEPQANERTETCSNGDETVLLVEDEPQILHMGRMLLTSLGYEVLTAGRAAEAIELEEKHGGRIHLLITDVIMPDMNGRDLAARLHSLHPDMKCLFMSGYTADVIGHHGVLEEGVHFIQKPFSMQALADKIRETLGCG